MASQGKYIITVVEGKDLRNTDFIGKSDPYLRLKFGKVTVKTTAKKDTLSPVWNETFALEVQGKEGNTMEVEVWDDNDFTKDQRLGSATVTLTDATHTWIQLVDDKKKKAGQVKLSFKYIEPAAGAAGGGSAKEGGLLGFLQEHGWIIYIVALLAVVAYKFFYKTKFKLPVAKGEVMCKAGDFVASDSHYLSLSTAGNLQLYQGTSPDTTSTLEWESATSYRCGRCVAFLSDDGDLQIKAGRKVLYSVKVSDVTDLSDVVHT